MAELVTIQGLDVFAQALKILPANVARRVLRGAVAAGGKVIRDEAKAKAPVFHGKMSQGHPPPGTLRRAIALGRSNRFSGPGKGFITCSFATPRRAAKGPKVAAGGKFDAYYWRYVEFGTSRMAARRSCARRSK